MELKNGVWKISLNVMILVSVQSVRMGGGVYCRPDMKLRTKWHHTDNLQLLTTFEHYICSCDINAHCLLDWDESCPIISVFKERIDDVLILEHRMTQWLLVCSVLCLHLVEYVCWMTSAVWQKKWRSVCLSPYLCISVGVTLLCQRFT